MITATRYHDFSAGHRVVGHEGKCQYLHGHNYRVHFTLQARLDDVGRVLDFSAIKERLCSWLEAQWDHRFLVFILDPLRDKIAAVDPTVAIVPFNPTAEHLASYLLEVICPQQLAGTGAAVVKVVVEETRKCSAEASL